MSIMGEGDNEYYGRGAMSSMVKGDNEYYGGRGQ